ncbi:MAG: translation initiation factor IF-2, partial [Thermoplasmatota archaeon]
APAKRTRKAKPKAEPARPAQAKPPVASAAAIVEAPPEPAPRKRAKKAAKEAEPAPAPKASAKRPRKAAASAPEPDGRCQATTKSGEPCRNKAQPGSRFCARHAA